MPTTRIPRCHRCQEIHDRQVKAELDRQRHPAAYFNDNGFLVIDFERWSEARAILNRLLWNYNHADQERSHAG